MPVQKIAKKVSLPQNEAAKELKQTIDTTNEKNSKEIVAEKVSTKKIELPLKESISKPAASSEIEKVKVRVIKSYENIYIGGKRYSGKERETIELPVDIAYILRNDGSVI